MTWLEQQICEKHNTTRMYDRDIKKWICISCDCEWTIENYGKNNKVNSGGKK